MIELLAGAAIAFFSGGVGFLVGRSNRPNRPTPTVKPICTCGHHIGAHEDGTGHCREQVNRITVTTKGRDDWYEDCACQKYSGPELISQISLQGVSVRELTTEE